MSFIIDFEKYYRKKKGLMSAEEEARYDSEQTSKQLHEKWKQEEENGSASSAMETSKRFENWMQNSKSLSSAYAKDATSRNYMNKTSSESSQFMLKNLADQAAKLQLDLEKNRSYLGDDYVSKATEYIRAATGQNKAVSDALTQKQDILSRFKDQTEYERAVKDSDYRNMTSEERLAEADRLESSNKSEADRIRVLDEQWYSEDFLSGKSYDQIKAEEKEIEQQILERRNRISEMMYSVSYYDTDEKKQQIQEERQQIMKEVDDLQKKHDILKQNEYYVKMDEAVSKVPEDMKYWLEKEAEYRQSAEAMNSPFDFIPAGTKLMDNKDEYAEAIRKVEQYAKENSQDIDLLKDYYTRKVNAEEAQVHAENMEALSDNVFGAIGGSIYSVPANILGGVSSVGGTIGNFVSNLFSEDYVPVDRYSKMYRHSDTADLIRGNVAENLGDVGGFLYQSGMSMADSLAVLPLNAVAPGAGAALLGTAAASSSIRDTLDRGGTTGEALANGIFAGVAETIFEKVSLDSLFKLKNVNSIKDAVTNIAKQSFTEGSEEFFTEISNRITDEIVMADKSAYNERVKELVLSGMSEEEAKKQSDTEFVQQLATSFAGGALSGGVFGAGKSVIDYRSSDSYRQNVEAKKVERANKLAEKKAKQEQQQSETQQATSETGDPIMDAAKQLAYRQEAESQEARESSPIRVTKVGENASIQTADGKTVSPENVNFLNDNQRQLYERATTFQTEAEANAFINNYDGKTNVDSYYSGYSAFSKAAQLYDSFDDAMKVNAYRQAANRIGESVAKSAFISTFNTQNNITVSQQERAEIQKTGGVIRNYSTKPSSSVSAQIEALEVIGKKYKQAIEVVDSIGGNANGFYDPSTKRIVVALDADEGGIVRVASHELYHSIESENADDAAQIRSFVISALKSKSDYDYEAQKKWLMSKGYSEADVDSEITAQSMFDVFDADTIEKLRDENPSLLQKIKNWIDSFFKVLEDAIDRLSTKKYGGAEIRALRNDREKLSKIREMVLQSLDNTANVTVERNTSETVYTTKDGGVSASVDNNVKFNVKDLEEDLQQYKNTLVSENILTEQEANTLVEKVESIMGIMKNAVGILDYSYDRTQKRKFDVYKSNSDSLYKYSLDFSTLCRKRLLQQYASEVISSKLKKEALTRDEEAKLRSRLVQIQSEGKNIEVACALCYVESKRLVSKDQINKFLRNPRSYIAKGLAKKDTDFNSMVRNVQNAMKVSMGYSAETKLKDLAKSDKAKIDRETRKLRESYEIPSEKMVYVDFVNNKDNRDYFLSVDGMSRLMDVYPELYSIYSSHIISSSRSKNLESAVSYRAGDVFQVPKKVLEEMNNENGLRHQSWSDFEIIRISDEISAIIDLSTVRAKVQSYSKVPEFVLLNGNTNMMINQSLIPGLKNVGFNENGSLDFDSVEGMDIDVAKENRKKYDKSVGNICIGVSDNHIKVLLNTDYIDMVIPYHKSGLTKAISKMFNIDKWTNYEKTQTEKFIGGGNPSDPNYRIPPKFSEWFSPSDNKSGVEVMKDSQEKYMRLCAERGLQIKFPQFKNEENYWKLLIDRKMIDNDGNIIIQKPVVPNFDFDVIEKMLREKVASYDQEIKDSKEAISRIISMYENNTLFDMKKSIEYSTEISDIGLRNAIEEKFPSVKFSVKDDSDVDTKALMRENEHLKKMLELARRELKRTKGHQVKPGTFENLANRYKRRYGSRMETAEIASALKKMYDYIANGEEPNAEVAFDMAADIARDIVNQSKLTSPALLEETKAVRDHLRNTAVYFPENVRSDINYSEIKSSLFGRLKIRNDGLPVDTYLAEMKEIFPEYADLPAESSAQATESLLSIVDGVYTEYVSATNEDIDSAAAILASDIFNDYFDVPEYKTFADKKYTQMQEQKMEYQKSISNLRQINSEKAERIEQFKKEISELKGFKNRSDYLFKQVQKLEQEKGFNQTLDKTLVEIESTAQTLINKYGSNMSVDELSSRIDEISRMKKRIEKANQKENSEQAMEISNRMAKKLYSVAKDLITNEKGYLNKEYTVEVVAYDIAENLFDVSLSRGYRTRLYAQRRDLVRKAKESERKQLVEKRRQTLVRSISRTTKNLIKRYTDPTNKQNIPLEFEAAVGDIFSNLDLSNIKPSSVKQSDWGDMVYYLQKVIDFKNKRKESVDYDSLSIYLDPYLRQNVLEASAQIYELAQQNGGQIDPSQIPNETLEIIDNSLLSILHSTVEYGKLKANQKQARVSELGEETIRTNETKYKKRPATINGIKQLVTLESADAHTFLLGLGESGEMLYQALQAGDAKAKLLMREAAEEIDAIINEEVEKDKKFKKKFYDDTVFVETFDGTEVSLNKQQVIDLYMLSKRTDALRHLIYGKYTEEQLNVTDFDKEQKTKSSDETKESKDKDIDYYIFEGQGFIVGQMRNPVQVTIDELKKVFKKHISPADKRVADKTQKYMSTRVAEWGNEVSLALYGIEKYTSENYMHMEIYQNTLDTKDSNMSEAQSITRILNPGFSKNVNRNATNPLVIRDAMDEVTGHISQMAYHSGLALPTADLYAWFNYRSKNGSVKRAMTDRYGDSPKFSKNKNNAEPASPIKYFENLLLDISGQMVGDPSQFGFLGKALTSYGKSQAVGANLRVAIQQFAAVFRSMGMVDPKYFAVPAKNPISEFNQAAKYSGAVAGKDMGVYNRYSQSQFSEVVTGRKNIRKRLSDLGMWPSEFVDKIQWGILWHAVKAETLKKHPNLVKNSEQHLKLAGQRMDEVCYETQVVGSVLTKTQLGRSKSEIIKSMTAFTSEQTTAINYMIRSYYRNGKKGLAKASAFNTVSTVIAGALASVVSAFRDDDDYKTWLEKYLSAFTGDVLKSVIPLGYMPFVSDVFEFITTSGGFENKIMAFEAIEQYKTLFDYIGKMLSGEEVDMLKFANVITKTFSVSTGIPLSNAEREIRTLWNTVVSTMGRNDLKWRTSDFYVTKDSTLYEQLYQAQMNNDQKTIQRVMEELESRDKTDSQIKTGLKNVAKDLFSGEIEEAAQAKNDGDTSTYERMLGEIQEQTPLERKDVQSLIDNAAKKLLSDEEDAETEQEESEEEQEETEIVAETDYSTTDIVKYVIDGGYSSSTKKAIDSYYSGYYDKYIKEGKTEKEAASKARGNIKSAITRYYKPMFVDGSPAEREKIKNVLNQIRVDGKKIYSNTDYGEWKKGTN